MLMRYTHRVGEGGWLIKPLIFLFSVLRIGGQLGELPDPQLLSGVERLSSLTPPPLVSINAENVQPSQPPIQLYTGQGLVQQKQAKAGGPVVVAPGMPAVPLKLTERMRAGEFVDFCELPPAKERARPVTGSMEGQLILVQAVDLYQTKKTDSRPGDLVSMFCPVHGDRCNEAAKKNPRHASIHGHNCKSKPEIPVAVLASIQPEFQTSRGVREL